MKNNERLVVLFFAFVMTMCFGAGYAWSVFAQELYRNYSFKMAMAQLPVQFSSMQQLGDAQEGNGSSLGMAILVHQQVQRDNADEIPYKIRQ